MPDPQPIEPSHDDWDHHWDEYALSAELNPAQRFRRRLIVSSIRKSIQQSAVRDLRIVDIGSGQGDLLADLHRALPEAALSGIDISETGAAYARRKVPGATMIVRNLLEPAEVPPEFREWANIAVCSEVLEHVDHPEKLLANAAACLAPGCRLIVTVPGGPMSPFDRHIGHRQHFTPELLGKVMTNAGYEVVRVMGAGFPFFNAYRLAVILKGDALIERARVGMDQLSLMERMAAGLFDKAFRCNLNGTGLGWQVVGIAVWKPRLL
jgi:2-polyprenyl-3-methyl-5-hydroxy-6-metoxy-1,4-benzoquinol methylase